MGLFLYIPMDDKFNVNFSPTASPVKDQQDIYSNLDQGYTGAIQGQEAVPNLISRYDDRFGVPQLQRGLQEGQEMYDTLGSQIRGLSRDVAQRSQESILTQGQKNRMVQAEQAPLLEQQGILGTNLSRMGANLGTAQSNAAKMVEAEQLQQQKELQPWLQKYDNENILSAMRMTGWSTQNEMELRRLLANQQAGITLSEGEKNRMNSLAIAEKGFQAQLEQTKEAGNQARLTKQTLPDLATLYGSMFG